MLNRFMSELRFRLRALLNRNQMERELDDELRFHLEQDIEKRVKAGVPRSEAERLARAAFGGVTRIKDDTRDARGIALFDTTMQDLRYALRSLWGRKTFAFGVVVTLALGIGANATMFGIVDRVLFRAPPTMRNQDRVHRLYRHSLNDNEPRLDRNFAFPTYLDLVRNTRSFSDIAAFQTRRLAVGEGDQVREMLVTAASAGYFRFFDAYPVLGRFYSEVEDSIPAGSPVAVLGYGFWQARYGGQDVLGQQIRIDRTLATIIGVAPKHFVGLGDEGVPAVYVPITSFAHSLRGPGYVSRYGWSWLELIARRAPGITPEAAEAELTAGFQSSWRSAAEADPGWGSPETARVRGELGPVQFERGPMAGAQSKVATWVAGVALVVLLIACANVANLLLARAVSRRREIALRLALGVSRGRLIRQLLTESLLLAAIGGVTGLLVAQWGAGGLRRWFLPADLHAPVVTDSRTLLFAALATITAALLTGLAPALHAVRGDVSDALRSGGREGAHERSRTRTALLVLQCALSVVLLVGAGLFVRSLDNVRSFRLGYDPDRILYARAEGRGLTPTPSQINALNQRMLSVARSIPGITEVTLAASVPFWSNEGRGIWVPGVDSVRRLGRYILQAGSPEYFKTMGTRILQGRAFNETDREGTPRVMVVSEGMARTIWRAEDPLGKCVRIGSDSVPCTTVIGVAEEMRIRTLADAREYSYYIPAWQYDGGLEPQLFARVSGRPADVVETLRRSLQAEMPGAAYVVVVPLTDLVDPNLTSWRMGATMFVAFGGLALLLAAIGLYSMIAYDVAQRTRDLGVRIALGARVSSVVRLIVVRGLRLVLVGLLLGGAVALWAAPFLENLMFDQPARDPAIFFAVSAVLVVVGLAAAIVPGLRAARVDPNVALRAD